MENFDIYKDIAERTQGDIYVGVVGPVRTGKSSFIKRFMDLMVIPNIENAFKKERAKDELPQSGSGKSIHTMEPKFVPNEAVSMSIGDGVNFKVRMVDCVGYIVNDLPPKSKYHFPRFGVIFTLFSFVNHVFFIVFGVTFLFWLIELCINFLFAEKSLSSP